MNLRFTPAATLLAPVLVSAALLPIAMLQGAATFAASPAPAAEAAPMPSLAPMVKTRLARGRQRRDPRHDQGEAGPAQSPVG